jgi:hypothetical protein
MARSRQKWHCPHCSQTSSRRWNLMTHIGRKHQGIGQPVREDGTHSITMSNAAMQFIPDMMMSLQNNNNNYELNHKVHPNSFSSSSSLRKEEDTPKKRDVLDEILEFWRPMIQKMKEIMEMKNTINEFFSYSSSLRQPSIITGLGRTPIIESTIPPVTITPLQPTTTTTRTTTPLASARSPQQQEQKNEKIIKLGTDLLTNLFISSTFKVPDFQRRLREGKVKDLVIAPLELSPTTPITTTPISTTPDNNNNSKKIEQANLSTENTKEEEELGEDNHYLEGHPLSRHKLLIDNEHDDGGGVDHVYSDYDDGGKWVREKDMFGNVIDACKVITDPPLEAEEYLLSNKAESSGENRNKKE